MIFISKFVEDFFLIVPFYFSGIFRPWCFWPLFLFHVFGFGISFWSMGKSGQRMERALWGWKSGGLSTYLDILRIRPVHGEAKMMQGRAVRYNAPRMHGSMLWYQPHRNHTAAKDGARLCLCVGNENATWFAKLSVCLQLLGIERSALNTASRSPSRSHSHVIRAPKANGFSKRIQHRAPALASTNGTASRRAIWSVINANRPSVKSTAPVHLGKMSNAHLSLKIDGHKEKKGNIPNIDLSILYYSQSEY